MSSNTSDICRLCLSVDVRMFTIAGSSLQALFEKLTNTKLHTADRRPTEVCYICHTHLKKVHKLMTMSAKTESILTSIVNKYNQITKESVSLIDDQLKDLHSKFTISKPEWIDTTLSPATVEVKIEQEIDDLFVTPASIGIETRADQAGVLDSTFNGERIKVEVEDYVECSEVTIITVKPDVELDIMGMENVHDESPQPMDTEDSDVDIENAPNVGNNILLDQFIFEDKPNISQKKSKLKTSIRKSIAADKKSKLNNKGRRDVKLYVCELCQRHFDRLCHLRTHMRTHTNEKPFQCNTCERGFSDKSSLNSHILIHTGVKPFECNICPRRFYKKNHLTRHLTVHNGNKPFECNVCCHKFFDRSGLECHLRIHSDEKPFECDMCHRRFNYKHVLVKHFRTHTGEKPHQCDVCRRSFARKFTLQTHLKKMHDRDTFKKQSL